MVTASRMFKVLTFLVCAIGCMAVATASDVDNTLVTTSGERIAGRVSLIEPNWNLQVQVDGKPRTLAAADWILWGNRRDPAQRPLLILADGSVLTLEAWRLSASHLTLPVGVKGIWNEAKVAREAARGMILELPANAAERDRLWQRVQNYRAPQDQLILENDDTLFGTILSSASSNVATTATDDAPMLVRLKTKTGEVEVAVARVRAVLFGSLLAEPERPLQEFRVLGLRDGTTLQVQHVHTQGNTARLALVGGIELVTDNTSLLDELAYLQSFGPNVTYISDLAPLGYKHIPFLSREWPYEKDRAVDGGWLRCGGRIFTKGLGMHSTSRLAYDLAGPYKTFQAELAIDQQVGPRGSVIFRVFVDRGEGSWQTAYESPVIRGGEKPLPISVNLEGANRMALIVDFADRGDECDHADWLNARLVK